MPTADLPTLGGSRIANAIGLGWDSPIAEFGRMTGKPGFPPIADTELRRLGRALQPVIFAELLQHGWYAAQTPDRELTDESRPWLVGHPDGSTLAPRRVVEAKAQAYPHPDPSAHIQLLTYMHLGRWDGGILATLAGLRLHVEHVERSQHRIDLILELAERFMGYVRRDEWPPPTGHPADAAALRAAHTATAGKVVRETKPVREARRELAALNAADAKRGARTRRKERLAGIVQAFMADAETLLDRKDEPVARWPQTTTRRFDQAAHKAAHPECHARFMAATTTRRFTLV